MQKNRLTILFASLSLIFLSTSCEKWKCIEGDNDIISEYRTVNSDFHSIEANGDFDVDIVQDTVYDIYVEADKNIMALISTDVRSGKLIIETNTRRCIRTDKPVYVRVSTPDIFQVEQNGSGYIYCDGVYNDILNLKNNGSGSIEFYNIDTRQLNLKLTGSGPIEVWGIADVGDYQIVGSGNIKSFHMELDELDGNISGSGDMYVFVYDYIDAVISGSGNIFYHGDPAFRVNITGTGDVINSN